MSSAARWFSAFLSALFLLPACTGEKAAVSGEDTAQLSVEPAGLDFTPDESADLGPQEWMALAEKTRERANALGYEWNTIKPLLEKGEAELKQGNEDQAMSLFREAKRHAELAIAQAQYADENWRMLIPQNN